MKKVSVLISVFNAEAYLEQCLDSLLAQTYQNLQILCVDDCSTDGSLTILQEYANRDSRISVKHLDQNVGPGAARNVGLAEADGEYVGMLDSDDWIAPDAIQCVVDVFENNCLTDCVLYHIVECKDGRFWDFPTEKFESLTGQEAFVKSLDWSIHGTYFIRTSLHKKFPYDTRSYKYNDENTARIHYLHAREVRCSNARYYYRHNPQSVSHVIDVHRFDYLRSNQEMREILRQLQVDDQVIDKYENVMWGNIVDLYMFYYKNRQRFSTAEQRYGLESLYLAWKGIDRKRLSRKWRKLGYFHCGGMIRKCSSRYAWRLFRLQEEIYFTLRKWCGR